MDIKALYREKYDYHEALRKVYKRRYNLNAIARLLIFVIGAIGFYYALNTTVLVVSLILMSVVMVFLALVQYSARLERKIRWHREMAEINQEELSALEGDYSMFDGGEAFLNADHPYAYDLDIFGQNGFFPTINRTVRPGGKALLANWLQKPMLGDDDIQQRQVALIELSEKLQWRQYFQAHARIQKLDEQSDQRINKLPTRTLKRPRFLVNRLVRWVVPVLTFAAILLASLGPLPVGYPILLVLIQWSIVGFGMKYTKKADEALGRTNDIMQGQKELIRLIDAENWDSNELKRLKQSLHEDNIHAIKSITHLAAIIKSFEYRNNLIVNFLANSLLLWDIQCLSRYLKWQQTASGHINTWMHTLDEIDGLISCSNYWYNNPDFAVPTVDDTQQLESRDLGHPLLQASKRVVNDYQFPANTFFHIVTGANMAGKSTFLRTVTLSMVMAMAGLPVCAKNFVFKPVSIFTSMRTTDSLSKDESYFYAELRRLREAFDRIKSGERVFLVLDEILKGTNSEDKRKGSMDFLTQIMQYDVGGIVATHDTQLGELANLYPDKFANYCFEIEIDGEAVSFDYKLQPGITQTMNAQLLMKQMGLID